MAPMHSPTSAAKSAAMATVPHEDTAPPEFCTYPELASRATYTTSRRPNVISTLCALRVVPLEQYIGLITTIKCNSIHVDGVIPFSGRAMALSRAIVTQINLIAI